VHAAAIVKARAKGHDWLADRVYSGVPAAMVGLTQIIEVGPMSGESNVVFWLRARGIDPTPERVAALYRAAKASDHVLAEVEIRTVLSALPDPAAASTPAGERVGDS
jgi:2-isopropylmalate synthase